MAATQTKIRRGTKAQIDAMTPVEGEIIADLTDDRLRLGDGLTLGGIVQAKAMDMPFQTFTFGTSTGTANALVLTLPLSPGSYAQPLTVTVKANAINTGATTINVNGLGAKNIYKVSATGVTSLTGGEIVTGGIYQFTYDGTQFVMVSGSAGDDVDLLTPGSNKNSYIEGAFSYSGSEIITMPKSGTITGRLTVLVGSGTGTVTMRWYINGVPGTSFSYTLSAGGTRVENIPVNAGDKVSYFASKTGTFVGSIFAETYTGIPQFAFPVSQAGP